MTGLPDPRKSVMASRTSCTFPHSAAAPAGRITTLEIRRSTFAFLSASTSDRTVGGESKNCPMTPPGSISWRLPPTLSTRVELPDTCGWRPTIAAMSTRPAAEMNTATTISRRMMPTPRLTATRGLLSGPTAGVYPYEERCLRGRDGQEGAESHQLSALGYQLSAVSCQL